MTLQSRGISAAGAIAAEKRRARALLDRDRAERAADQYREEARRRVENGDAVSGPDTVLPPTDEWLSHCETTIYRPKLADNSARAYTTVRRVEMTYVLRLHRSRRIDDGQFAACVWYRSAHEEAGLGAQYATTRFSADAGGGAGAFGHLPANERAVQARLAFRAAQAAVGAPLAFFDRVVIGDVPLTVASAHGHFGQKRALSRFRSMVDRLIAHRDEVTGGKESTRFHGDD